MSLPILVQLPTKGTHPPSSYNDSSSQCLITNQTVPAAQRVASKKEESQDLFRHHRKTQKDPYWLESTQQVLGAHSFVRREGT